MSDRRRQLPSVEVLLSHPGLTALGVPRVLKRRAAREVLEAARRRLAEVDKALTDRALKDEVQVPLEALPGEAEGASVLDQLAARAVERARALAEPGLRRVINATGVVVHTNLGRSVLSEAARSAVAVAASGYSTLEFNLATGARGSRLATVRELLIELTGAEDALVVNNNAAGVMLTLSGLAAGKEVIVSRGELIEIGGSFRLPEIMARSGAVLREVGTTNKTRIEDYERAIGPDTALLLKAHRSNFVMQGFVSEVGLAELVALGRARGLPVVEDLGSGALLDLSATIGPEPTARESLAAGAAIVLVSGDKLLGGPQAGILVGQSDLIRQLSRDPMARALRLDKLSIAALEATLRAYLEPERVWDEVPTLRLLARPLAALEREAAALAAAVTEADPELAVEVVSTESRVGGGALPMAVVESAAVALRPRSSGESVEALEAQLRHGDPPILGRIEAGQLLLDMRTLLPGDAEQVVAAVGRSAQVRRHRDRSMQGE